MQEGEKRFNQLLDELGIERGDLLYLQSSFKRLGYLGLTAEQLLNALLDRLGINGTLVLPSFTWNLDRTERPWKGYQDFFDRRPVFDVRNSPANIGWLPESFRMMEGVQRSLNYFFPVCAKGTLARELTAHQETVPHPWGPESSFELLRIHRVKIVGLGVSLNTNSLGLACDYALGAHHPHQVFTDEFQEGPVIDYQGKEVSTRSIWLLPEVVRRIKPGALIAESSKLSDSILRGDEGSTIHFSYPFKNYYEEGLRLGRKAIDANHAVPWLKNYPLR